MGTGRRGWWFTKQPVAFQDEGTASASTAEMSRKLETGAAVGEASAEACIGE
jgi:hypothetical protein